MSAELASVEEALEAHIPEPYLTEVVPEYYNLILKVVLIFFQIIIVLIFP